MAPDAPPAPRRPPAPIDRLTRPLAHFLHVQSAGGVVLLLCTVVALVLANSPAAGWWDRLWHTHVVVEAGGLVIGGDLAHFLVNDVLMTVFFFVVGLEIKRELVAGELRDPRKAALPVAAALGGMVAPALIYYSLQRGQPGERGWGVPMATDIAFVVGVLALVGDRVPPGLKVLLLSLAIADDIGAVVVIAAFYSAGVSWGMLGAAAAAFALAYALNRLGVRPVGAYVAVGAGAWLAMLRSGVHPTIAGVALGLLTPSAPLVGGRPSGRRSPMYSPASTTRASRCRGRSGRRWRTWPGRACPRWSGWSTPCTRGSGSSSCPCSRWRTPGWR
jgi:NhaA family Na+:H+ antiporter